MDLNKLKLIVEPKVNVSMKLIQIKYEKTKVGNIPLTYYKFLTHDKDENKVFFEAERSNFISLEQTEVLKTNTVYNFDCSSYSVDNNYTNKKGEKVESKRHRLIDITNIKIVD